MNTSTLLLDYPATAYYVDSGGELTQYAQLGRQGKTHEVIKLATAGWKFRPEKGDHDRGPEPL